MNTTTNILSAVRTSSAQSVSLKTSDTVLVRAADKTSASQTSYSSKRDSFDSALNRAQSSQEQPEANAAEEARDPAQPVKPEAGAKADKPDTSDANVKAADTTKAKATDAKADSKDAKEAKDVTADSSQEDEPKTTVNAAALNLNALLLALAGNAGSQTVLQTAAQATSATAAKTPAAQAGGTNTAQNAASLQAAVLDALLPQDANTAAQAAQNQQLLNMLSGTTGQAALATPELTQLAAAAMQQNANAATTAASGLANATAADAKGAALLTTLNAADTQLTAGNANAAADTAKTDAKSDAKSDVSSLLDGIQLTVENRGEAAATGQPGEQAAGDMLKKQPDAQPQAPVLQSANGKTVQSEQQLPEEAQFDTAVTQKTDTASASAQGAAQAAATTLTPTLDLSSLNSLGNAGEVNQPQTNYDIPKQIVEQAKLIRSVEDTQMVIKLKPEHLGELTLKVSVSADGAVNASFHSDNAQVRGIIESSMVQLKQELQAQGLKVDNVSVYAGLSQDFFGESQAGQQGYPQQSSSARSQKLDRETFAEDAESVTATAAAAAAAPSVATENGVDYRV